MRQNSGKSVLFGDVIQLYHVKSKKYLTILPKTLATDERENLRAELTPDGNPLSWLNVVPRYKIDREGDPVLSGVELLLKVSLRHSEYVHASEKRPRQGEPASQPVSLLFVSMRPFDQPIISSACLYVESI